MNDRDINANATPYERWVASQGVPVHEGYYIEDLRTLELGWWEERQCNGAFLKLAGQEGISEARVTEISAGKTLPPLRFLLDEIVYVAEGRGLTTVWGGEGPKKSFEWQKHSMFLIPRNYTYQHGNMQGTHSARLLHYNFLPLAMAITPDPKFFFNNTHVDMDLMYGPQGEFYSEARAVRDTSELPGRTRSRSIWTGNFFPDMRSWDKLDTLEHRGAGGNVVMLKFPNSAMKGHMSVFSSRTYKKAHRHGPGVVIVIPAGEGYSIMWREGEEKIVIPWHEASVMVPPDRWFHQHFNVGGTPARYLAFHSPDGINTYSEKVEDLEKDQIEYTDEDPLIRERFEKELAKCGLKSVMPEEAYQDKNYEWSFS